MNKSVALAVAVVSVAMISSPAWARHKGSHNQACAAVWKACEAGGKEGKDAKECVKTIKDGGMVAGVTVNDADAKKCQASAKGKSEGGAEKSAS